MIRPPPPAAPSRRRGINSKKKKKKRKTLDLHDKHFILCNKSSRGEHATPSVLKHCALTPLGAGNIKPALVSVC